MNIAIIGSRTFDNYELMKSTVNNYVNQNDVEINCVVSGGAKGADTLAEKFANEYDLETIVYKPDWGRLGRGAALARNTQIIDHSDIVFAFWNGTSTGTKDSITKAHKKNKIVVMVMVDEETLEIA